MCTHSLLPLNLTQTTNSQLLQPSPHALPLPLPSSHIFSFSFLFLLLFLPLLHEIPNPINTYSLRNPLILFPQDSVCPSPNHETTLPFPIFHCHAPTRCPPNTRSLSPPKPITACRSFGTQTKKKFNKQHQHPHKIRNKLLILLLLLTSDSNPPPPPPSSSSAPTKGPEERIETKNNLVGKPFSKITGTRIKMMPHFATSKQENYTSKCEVPGGLFIFYFSFDLYSFFILRLFPRPVRASVAGRHNT